MSLFSFKDKSKKANIEREERLRKARKDAYRQATMQLARGNVNLMLGNFITREEVDAEFEAVAKDLARLDN